MAAADEIRGVLTAMATPFDGDGAVDFDASRHLARHLVENGSHGVVVAGTTGESPTLDDSEKLALLAAVIDEIGQEALVICGTGSNDTRHTVELTRAAAEIGADGALIVTPYYNRPNAAGIQAHFEAAAGAAPDLPIVIYNIPSRVAVNIEPEQLGRLGRIDNIVALKEANNSQLQQIDGLSLLAGNDEIFLRTLELGGAGGVLVASHVVGPRMRRMWELATAGDLDGAREAERELEPLYSALSVATNPIQIKAALEMLGVASGRMRLPMVEAAESERAVLARELERLGLTGGA